MNIRTTFGHNPTSGTKNDGFDYIQSGVKSNLELRSRVN
jgi:hypothetical protein